MKNIFSLILLFASVLIINAQPFQNTFDFGNDDYANMSVMDVSGDIYSVGSSNFTGAGGYDAILQKVDAAGNFIWHKQYGESGTEYGTAFIQTTDGFVIASFSTSFSGGNQDILLIKTDINGDLQWAKTYGASGDEFATYISSTNDNGFIITGQTNSFGRGIDAFLLKTDSDGNVEWFKTYGSNSDELGYFARQADDNGYVVAGSSTGFPGAGQNDIYLFETDSAGSIETQFLIGGAGQDEARRVAFGPNGTLILAGNSDNDIFIAELDTQTLTFNWFNIYGGTGSDGLTNMSEIPGEGYVISGLTQSFGPTQDGLVFMIDTVGSVGFAAILDGGSDDIAQDIAITNNGGLVTGYSNSFGGIFNDILMFIIGDDPPCFAQGANLTVTPQSPSIAGPVLPNHSDSAHAVTANSVVLTQSSTTATVTDVCPDPLSADAGDDQTICGSGQVQIGGNPSASGGIGTYTYAWSPATGLDDSTAANPNASPSSTTTYVLTVTDTAGTIAVDDITVTVSQIPVVSVTPTDTTICSGESVILFASGADSYSWSPIDGLSATDISNPAASPSSTITYTVTGTILGCSATAIATVTVIPSPIITVSPANPAICNADSVMLTASGATSYSWTPALGLSATDVANPTAFPANTTLYTVTSMDSGCSGMTTVTVTVDQIPVATINPPGPNICQGQNVTLTASGGTSYSWSTGETTAVIVDFPTSVTTPYSVTVTNSCGTATATEIVTSHTRPTVTVTPTNPTICDTSSIGITLHASGAETYEWTPSTGLSNDTSSNPIALPGTTTTYNVTGKNGHCAGNNPTIVTVTVDVCNGIRNMPQSIANIFPNPAKDVLNINIFSEGFSEGVLSIIAMDGKIALEEELRLNTGINAILVHTSDLISGFYFVRMKTEEGLSIGKVIIE